jgi:hypothetical protein
MCWAVWLLVAAAVLTGSGCGAVAVHQGDASNTRTSSPSVPVTSPVGSPTGTPQSSPVACSTPPNRVDAGMANMSNLGEAVMFGGQGTLGHYGALMDTWTWRIGCWTQRHPAHSPPAYRSASMAFDGSRRVIAYLGDGDPGQEQATWSWDGAAWTRLADGPATYWAGAPDSSIAYDASKGQVVLYGLVSQAGATQTWTWNGTTWQPMNPRHSPPGRLYTGMAYDVTTGRVLLFGGGSAGPVYQPLGDTWAWDGADWTQLWPAHSPPARSSAAMVSFAAWSRVLVVGGAAAGELSDAWAWDGSDWTAIPSLGTRTGAAAADVGSRVILFGGTSRALANTDAWDGQAWGSS